MKLANDAPLVLIEIVQPLNNAAAFLTVARVYNTVQHVRRALRLGDVGMGQELECLGR